MNLDSLLADIARDADKFLAAVLPQLHSTAFVVLTLLTALFVFFFLLPGIWHGVRFRLLRNRLTSASSQNAITEFDEIFAKHKRLDYLWREYRESLHIQRIERDGKTEIIAVRATGQAEIYFNNQFLVDTAYGILQTPPWNIYWYWNYRHIWRPDPGFAKAGRERPDQIPNKS